jgi:predicted dehydrogenase
MGERSGVRIGILGVGSFAQHFIPLYQRHPLVQSVTLCDHVHDKLNRAVDLFHPDRVLDSFDDLLDSDVDSVVIITQPWLHAEQALRALRAGKHVYSAVPTGQSLDEVRELVQVVTSTGLVYMLGETSYYYPSTIYCRERFGRGDFGKVVYSEGEYRHDFDLGLYQVMRNRAGDKWRELGGAPPMYYPTHSISQITSVTGAFATRVSCVGLPDTRDDGVFDAGTNQWKNRFSNEIALFTMSDGSCCRIGEFRRVGYPEVVRMNMVGTEGTFEMGPSGGMWLTRHRSESQNLDDDLRTDGVSTEHGRYEGLSRLHAVDRLPREFAGLSSGHSGSHAFLVDDFVRASHTGEMPPNNVWTAARYMVPGLIAHESALRGGETLDVPDFGDPPAM